MRVAGRNRDQIRRDGVGHPEAERAAPAVLPPGVSGSALITARRSRGTVRAAPVCRMPGLS
jgi:hypothetical protein